MVVQHNISAMTANRYYGVNNKGLASSLEKLASGYAINKAGDNAAGLAVSEKMRAQIGGLTQASKNAEDGISMVQTFEGALQETDSILQRMRTLAVQSANGSYQDDVDRDAIQLEFDQLNDELNQIADTDYNGTVVLNGGQMADGLKQVDGKFDYANKKAQVREVANANIDKEIETARANLTDVKTTYNKAKFDLTESGTAREFNTIDDVLVTSTSTNNNSSYTKTAADNLWKALCLTDTGATTGNVDCAAKGTDVSLTFEAVVSATTGAVTWKAKSGTATGGLNGDVDVTNAFKTAYADTAANGKITLTTTNPTIDGTTPANNITGTGGLDIKIGTTTVGALVDDFSGIKNGDTVTLTFSNADPSKYAPNKIQMNQDSVNIENTGATADAVKAYTVAIGDYKDATMTAEVDNAYTALEDAEITFNYNDGEATTVSIKGSNDQNATEITISDSSATQAAPFKVKVNGTDVWAVSSATSLDAANTTIKFYATDTEAKSASGKALFTITNNTAKADGTKGTVSAKLSVSAHGFEDGKSTLRIGAGDDKTLESSNALHDKLTAAQKVYDDAVAKKERMNTDEGWEEAKAYAATTAGGRDAVSISDKFDQSMAKLTYADSMSLQVGARTKDLVNFTFAYNTDDLGGLEKNLNCSAREGGLETEKLDLTTQQGANDAIDKIDKALNKVNMVRATFGAIQNRLEHKISNIDTNTENMTAAESRIRDTQMDKEMMKFTSSQILSQASQSMLAQANSLPQGVLQLLG